MTLPGLAERYEVVRVLGEGGMGVVYLALQKKLNRYVAIKSIAPYLAREPQIRERFASEAAVLARLNHPNIVTLYDYIEEEGALYLIMEYVEGQPLAQKLQQGPLSLEEVRHYFKQVLEAFAYAHRQGIVHRDIKPANLMITSDRRVKILDFGVARLLQTDHSLTRTGMRIGTLMYMSPEQIKGERELDARSDIYSLGVVLYEMLVGQPPYPPDISEFHLSLRIVQEPLFDLAHPPATLPSALGEIILKATEKQPAYRYPSCEAFLADFEAAFREVGEAEGQRSPEKAASSSSTSVEQPAFPQPARKSKWPIITLLLVVGAGIGLGAFGFWRFSKGKVEPASSPAVMPETLLTAVPPPIRVSPASKALPPASPPKPVPAPPSQPRKEVVVAASPPPTPPPSPKPLLQVEVGELSRTLIPSRTKAKLFLRNTGEGVATNIQILLHLFDKAGALRQTDTITIRQIGPQEEQMRVLEYSTSKIHAIRAEILHYQP
ncbi:MAG: serine/threonine protein kinase [Bacteroidia bacterium]|nr:serine/threonine protein kinase [Bacteroidia bacterium]MDW8089700.1 serine/threonine-protein kinase [Bacteroidia bacterium]